MLLFIGRIILYGLVGPVLIIGFGFLLQVLYDKFEDWVREYEDNS